MTTTTAQAIEPTFIITEEIRVDASMETTFNSLVAHLGRLNETPDGRPLAMVLETRPGGRWYRDLGDNAGHLWGHVQVIKPPTLLELCGPMFMSFPGINHIQYRLTAEGGATHLKFTHRAMGPLPDEVRENVGTGWDYGLGRISEIATRLVAERKGGNGR
jgi:hypothetical protein